jgi:hypothetical protein
MNDEGRLLASFSKNPFEKIRITLRTWEDREYVDLRVYKQSGKPGEQDRNLNKGFTMKRQLFGDFVTAVEAAMTALAGIPASIGQDVHLSRQKKC